MHRAGSFIELGASPRCLFKLKRCRALGSWLCAKYTNTAPPSIHPFHADSLAKHIWMLGWGLEGGQWSTAELEFRSPCQVFYNRALFWVSAFSNSNRHTESCSHSHRYQAPASMWFREFTNCWAGGFSLSPSWLTRGWISS